MALIGETIETQSEICGAGTWWWCWRWRRWCWFLPLTPVPVLSRRPRGDKIAIWIRSKTPRDSIFQVGARAAFAMELSYADIQMDFSYHSDSMKNSNHSVLGGAHRYSLDNIRDAVRRGDIKLVEAV